MRFQDFQRFRDFVKILEIFKDFKNNLFQHFKSHVTAKTRNYDKYTEIFEAKI